MAILTRPSFAPSTAIIYITLGALIDVWTSVYYFSFVMGSPDKGNSGFWVIGLFLSGLILMGIGFFLGRIGRAARQVEMPPAEVTPQSAQAEIEGARHSPVITNGRPMIRTIPSNNAPASPAATAAPAAVERTIAE